MPRASYIDYKFQRGWQADLSPVMASKEELVLADNAYVMDRGGIKQRFGTEALNTTALGGQVEQIIEWPRDDGSFVLMAIINDGTNINLCKINPDWTTTTIQAINNTRIPHFFLFDKFYFIDPGTEYYVYDGSTCSAVTPNPESDCDLTPIKRCKFAFWHSKSMRIFFAGDSQEGPALYYSEYNQPDYVKADSVVYPTRADGPIKGLSVLMDAVIVGYRFSNWVWRGIDPAVDTIWERLPTSHGPLNGDCFTVTTNSLSMVSEAGIFAMSPSIIGVPMEAEVGSNFIVNISKNRVNSIINSIKGEDKVRTIFDNDTGLYMIAYCDDASGRNNKILAFDWDLKAFANYTGLKVNDFCKRANGDLLLAIKDYILRVVPDGTEDRDDTGTAKIINFDIKTPKYNFNLPLRKKRVSYVYVLFKNFGPQHELDIKLYVDDEAKEAYTIKGDDDYSGIITHRKKLDYTGNYFQLEIINDQYSEVELYGVGFDYEQVPTVGDKV